MYVCYVVYCGEKSCWRVKKIMRRGATMHEDLCASKAKHYRAARAF